MITEREGDIFEQGDINIILHCANLYCRMGSGIAAQVKKKRPEAYQADLDSEDESDIPVWQSAKLGSFTQGATVIDGNSNYVFNLYGQIGVGGRLKPDNWDRNTSYDAIYDAMRFFKECYNTVLEKKKHKVGIPYGMASDLAGGKWRIIRAMIDSLFLDEPYEVVIVRFPGMRDLD